MGIPMIDNTRQERALDFSFEENLLQDYRIQKEEEGFENSQSSCFCNQTADQRNEDLELLKMEIRRQEEARLEQLKQEALRQEALKQEALRQDALKQEALRQEALRQEALRQEALRQEASRIEALRQEAQQQQQQREDAAKQAAIQQEQARVLAQETAQQPAATGLEMERPAVKRNIFLNDSLQVQPRENATTSTGSVARPSLLEPTRTNQAPESTQAIAAPARQTFTEFDSISKSTPFESLTLEALDSRRALESVFSSGTAPSTQPAVPPAPSPQQPSRPLAVTSVAAAPSSSSHYLLSPSSQSSQFGTSPPAFPPVAPLLMGNPAAPSQS